MKIKLNEKLSMLQGLKAMSKFLEKFYKRTSSDDIGSLLGDIQLLKDGCTADPAAWYDWVENIQMALDEERNEYQA